MDSRQQQYLKAMGVTAWVRRELNPDLEQANEAEVIPSRDIGAVASTVMETHPVSPVISAIPSVKPVAPVAKAAEPAAVVADVVHIPVAPVAPAGDWDGLVEQVDGCQQCDLYKTRLNAVFGVGHHHPEWMVIGDAPGADEDKRKQPFVGEAGLLLNAMLQAAGVKRASTYITNSIKCRPPNNRTPKPQELSACSGYLRRQIALLQPRLIIALGAISAQGLLHSEQALGELRGRIHHYGEQQIPLIVTHHPAHLLRVPADKRQSWADLQLAMSVSSNAAAN